MNQVKFGIGQSLTRKEDDPLLRGQGHYTSDNIPAGVRSSVVVRSPHAHARFRITDTAAAKAMPGVELVLTAADLEGLGNFPCVGLFPGSNITVPEHPVLVKDEARYVGDAVAFVVARTLDQARDAAEAIVIEWQPLPPVVGLRQASRKESPAVWPSHPDNQAFVAEFGDAEATREAFAKAAQIASVTLVNQRLVTNYMETRAVVAEYDAKTDRLTLTLGSQGSHRVRDVLCKNILHIPTEKMRVITPDVGGGFGTRLFPYREYALAAYAARALKAPVRWISDRSEHFLSCTQGRDNLTTARVAMDEKGHFLALEVETLADMGAYLSSFAPYVVWGGIAMLPGVYHFPVMHLTGRGFFTNTVPVDAYRGAGRPEAAYVIERLVDAAAREIGVGPDVIRRRNFIAPKSMPYKTATGKLYDTGEFAGHMARAMEVADWKNIGRRAVAARKAGRWRGIGMATYIEACGNMGPETARVRLDPDGGVTVIVGSQATGQGHHTAYAQIVSEYLSLPLDRVQVRQGDTDMMPTGLGTGGSSSIPSAGHSVQGAAVKLADNIRKLAADALEASPADLEIDAGGIRVVGTDRHISLAELAGKNAGSDLLRAEDAFTPKNATFPNGTHVVEVEIDPETGVTEIVNYVIVDDVGAVLNPILLQGQVHGGVVQSLGQVLMEGAVFDEDSGQLLAGSLMDYALPRATDCPSFTFETRNVPCASNPMGVKGAGEAGTIGATPALMNAIIDALARHCGVHQLDMPATPARVWAAIAEAEQRHRM